MSHGCADEEAFLKKFEQEHFVKFFYAKEINEQLQISKTKDM